MENINEAFKKMQTQDLSELAERNKREEEQKPLSFDEAVKRFVCVPYSRNACFYMDDGTRFVPLRSEGVVRRQAKGFGLGNDEIEQLLRVIESKPILYVYGALAGYSYGIHRFGGENVLVVNSAPWIEGKKGDWATIKKFLYSRFYDPQYPEQFHILMCWLKGARKRIREARDEGVVKTAIQLLAIVGGAGIGKTSIILNLLIAPLLATPKNGAYDGTKFLSTQTGDGYNGNIEKYPVIVLDDVHKGASQKVRECVFAKAKNILYSGAIAIEAKFQNPISAKLPWSVIQMMNEDSECLKAFPIVGNDETKVIGLLASEYSSSPPFATDAEKKELDKMIESELPAFAYAVDNYEVPEYLLDVAEHNRHCCKAWVHPKLAEMVHEISPEARLLELIDMGARRADMDGANLIYQEDAKPKDLYNAVKDNLPSNYKREFEQLAGSEGHFGRKLKALSERPNSCVIRKMSGNNPLYTILRPVERNEKWE